MNLGRRQLVSLAGASALWQLLPTNLPEERVRRNKDKWNVAASKFSDQLLQGEGSLPPEQFRQAIEQYLQTLSGLERGSATAPKE